MLGAVLNFDSETLHAKLLVLPLLELLPWINDDLNPKALVYEDFLRETTMTFPFSELRVSTAPDGCWE